MAGLAALTGTLAGTLTGCTDSSLPTGPTDPPPTGSPSSSASGSTTRDHDVRLAAQVLDSEQAMLDRVLAALRAHPRLVATLAGARAAHSAHVDLLIGAVPPEARRPAPAPRRRPVTPRSSAAALSVLAGREDRLARLRTTHALDARSGPFARVLASMSAAAAQQSALLAAAARDQR